MSNTIFLFTWLFVSVWGFVCFETQVYTVVQGSLELTHLPQVYSNSWQSFCVGIAGTKHNAQLKITLKDLF